MVGPRPRVLLTLPLDARFYVPLPISATVSIFTVSAFFLTLTPNILILFTVILQHIIMRLIHVIGYTALLEALQLPLVRCAAMLL